MKTILKKPVPFKKEADEKEQPIITYSEAEVADITGISINQILSIRKNLMIFGKHYTKDSYVYRILPAGLGFLMECLGKKEGDLKDIEQPELHRLCVVKITNNPQILEAKKIGQEDRIVRIKVKVSQNWKVGMPMWKVAPDGSLLTGCRQINEGLYTYEFPAPRQPGRL